MAIKTIYPRNALDQISYTVECDFHCGNEVSKRKATYGDAADEARRVGYTTVPGLRLTDPSSWCCTSERCKKQAQQQKKDAA